MRTWAVRVGLSLLIGGCAAHSEVAVQGSDGPTGYEIPYDKLSDKHHRKVLTVMKDVTVTVPLDVTRVISRQAIYDFLLEELPFTAGAVRALGKAKYEVFRDDDRGDRKTAEEVEAWRHTYYMDDKAGLNLKVELVRAEKNRRIFYTYGNYDLAPLPKVWGKSVIVVIWRENGAVLETEARVYARVESGLYKALSEVFKGAIENVIREKSLVFINAARTVTELAAKDPEKLYSDLKYAPDIDAKILAEFKKKFLDH